MKENDGKGRIASQTVETCIPIKITQTSPQPSRPFLNQGLQELVRDVNIVWLNHKR